jgi:Mlc titration factor MtfA (ptsG expression regulator)
VYGATNKAEFFAVAAEYFFEQPEMFKKKHAELYHLMTQIFNQHP